MEQIPNIPNREKFVSGDAIYLEKSAALHEELDRVETELADAEKNVDQLEKRKEELLILIKSEEQTRLN